MEAWWGSLLPLLEYSKLALFLINVALALALLYARKTLTPTDEGKEEARRGPVLLVTAHPDDEAMFFVPTLLALAADGRRIHLLCLSTGDFGGGAELGRVRTRELRECATRALGVIRADDIKVVDDPDLKDGFHVRWSSDKIARLVGEYVREHDVETIITFDEGGVSGHPNHIAVHHGVARYLAMHGEAKKMKKEMKMAGSEESSASSSSPSPSSSSTTTLTYRGGSSASTGEGEGDGSSTSSSRRAEVELRGFKLETTNLARKYAGLLDVVWSGMMSSEQIVFTTPLRLGFWPVHRCMQAHRSQYVWFRRLYVPFSRYSYVNTLLPITAPARTTSASS